MMHITRARSALMFIAFISCGFLSSPVLGDVSLDVSAGLGDHIVQLHYTPLRVALEVEGEVGEGRVVVKQLIGTPLQGVEIAEQVLYEGPLTSRDVEASIPIFDPLNPVEVRVETLEGDVLASEEAALRLLRRASPFPVVCGTRIEVAVDAVFVDASELPRDWWGLESARSLWIGGDAKLTNAAWQSISEWVFAGGTLVLLTGSDFFRLDTPRIRPLLPVGDPVVVEGSPARLAGSLRPSAEVLLWQGEEPLVSTMRIGAGRTYAVSLAASELSRDAVDRIARVVKGSSIPSARRVSILELNSIQFVRPTVWYAPLLTLLLAGAFLAYAKLSRRRPRASLAVLLLVVLGAAVLSGFVSNDTKQAVDLYAADTTVTIQGEFGIQIGYMGIYSIHQRDARLPFPEGAYPTQSLIDTIHDPSFALDSVPGETTIHLQSHEVRGLGAYGRASGWVSFAVQEGRLSIRNASDRTFEKALAIVDGLVYDVEAIPPGVTAMTLGVGTPTFLFRSGLEAVDLALDLYEEHLDFERGSWLLTIARVERIERRGMYGRKVRDTEFVFTQGDET